MKEIMENAREELKRIDHLIYVTLKYTRTVDVFISIFERTINCYDFIIEALLKNIEKLEDVPDIPVSRAELVKKNYEQKKIKDNMKKYLLIRKLLRSEYEKSSEFRRHVTMTAIVEGEEIKVTIDSITEDFHKLKAFVDYVKEIISEHD